MDERKRRRSIFDIFDEFMREFEEEFEDMVRSFSGDVGRFKPYVYGFRITIGPDGKPKIEEFGNVKRMGVKPKIAEEIEPLVDVIEEDDKVKVVAEMPGVEKEKISVRASEDTLVIKGSNANKKYYKEVKLPAKVKPETAKATYRNGVLEVTIEKSERKSGGVEIKID